MTESSTKRGLSPVFVIFFTILIDMIGFGIVIPILPLYSLHFNATDWQIGILFGCFSLMQLIFAPLLGRWSDRIGRRPILLLSILGTSLSFLIMGLANTLWLLFLGRLIDGASGGNIPTAQAYIADVTPLEKRSGAMGLIGAAFGLGFVIGPAIGGLLGHYSIQLPFYVAAGLALLNAVAIYLFLPESLNEAQRKAHPAVSGSLVQNFLQVKNSRLGTVMWVSLLSTLAFSLVTALFTLFTAHRLQWHARENGWLFAYIGMLGVLIQGGMLRRMVPKVGEKPLIIVGSVFLFISMALLPVSSNLIWVVVASSALAIGNSLVTPLVSGLASKSADAQSQGIVLGVLQSTASLGRMFGPMVGGFLLQYDANTNNALYGISPFWFSALLMVATVVVALRLPEDAMPDSAVKHP
ncbi:MFS transporter [Vampirovibrio chlorellavorus]|uniref:MFS transporter n=1 Tax=Vampirovibrio chlorellavorus TaxID=758823 RepID=UPI0026F0068C|nr:MFS transporter [Vampirovibrio chlorellavorus]